MSQDHTAALQPRQQNKTLAKKNGQAHMDTNGNNRRHGLLGRVRKGLRVEKPPIGNYAHHLGNGIRTPSLNIMQYTHVTSLHRYPIFKIKVEIQHKKYDMSPM